LLFSSLALASQFLPGTVCVDGEYFDGYGGLESFQRCEQYCQHAADLDQFDLQSYNFYNNEVVNDTVCLCGYSCECLWGYKNIDTMYEIGDPHFCAYDINGMDCEITGEWPRGKIYENRLCNSTIAELGIYPYPSCSPKTYLGASLVVGKCSPIVITVCYDHDCSAFETGLSFITSCNKDGGIHIEACSLSGDAGIKSKPAKGEFPMSKLFEEVSNHTFFDAHPLWR